MIISPSPRLKVIDIELPPLRERREDVPFLVQHFIDKFSNETKKKISGVSENALKLLVDYSWPGNVRELENVIQRAITLTQYDMILPDNLPSSMLQEIREDMLDISLRGKYTIDQLEKDYIRKILIEVGGNKSKAAEILGLDRKTLYRKLEEL
jgi:DNA-binding NtrC family response regulator